MRKSSTGRTQGAQIAGLSGRLRTTLGADLQPNLDTLSSMLHLARGRVVDAGESSDRYQKVLVSHADGSERQACSFTGLTGPIGEGDEVLVNTEALDLGLGSGGFDIVVAVIGGELPTIQAGAGHVMKLNYTPIQHSVELLEEDSQSAQGAGELRVKVGILFLHSQLSAVAFRIKSSKPAARITYIQTAGGALPGALSDTVATLIESGHIDEHVTVAPCFGGGREALTTVAALDGAAKALASDCALIGPGPGIQGSNSAYGHGGMEALNSAHTALSLGIRPVIVPRTSFADKRSRHQGVSHHSSTVLSMLLAPVDVALPSEPDGDRLEAQLIGFEQGHQNVRVETEDALRGFAASGLPAECMGRKLEDDPIFFRTALAGGAVLVK